MFDGKPVGIACCVASRRCLRRWFSRRRPAQTASPTCVPLARGAATPVKGQLQLDSWSRDGGESGAAAEERGQAGVAFEDGPAGLRVHLPRELLQRAELEDRLREKDPDARTPALTALRLLDLRELKQTPRRLPGSAYAATRYILSPPDSPTVKSASTPAQTRAKRSPGYSRFLGSDPAPPRTWRCEDFTIPTRSPTAMLAFAAHSTPWATRTSPARSRTCNSDGGPGAHTPPCSYGRAWTTDRQHHPHRGAPRTRRAGPSRSEG